MARRMRSTAVVLACLASAVHGYEAPPAKGGSRGGLDAVRTGHGQLALLLLRCIGPSTGWHMPRQLQQRFLRHGTSLAINSPTLSRCHSIVSLAKKKGGKGKKKNKPQKMSFAEMAQNLDLKPFESSELRELADAAVSTYSARSGGKSLMNTRQRSTDNPKALWAEPVAVMVVKEDASSDTGAVVSYANLAALEMHGLASDGYKTLFNSPTVLSVKMGDKKYESGYSKKLRIAHGLQRLEKNDTDATTVTMLDADRWLLEKMAIVDGKIATQSLGVAYAWDTWELPDGMLAKPGGEIIEPEEPAANREETQASLDKVAAAIRKLKEEDGKTNQDPEVVELVSELKEFKALLAELDSQE